MKKLTFYLLTTLSLFSSCYKPVDEDSDSFQAATTSDNATAASDETCQLSVNIISMSDEDAAPSPIHLFAFDAEGRVAAQCTMADASQPEPLTLTRGRYHLTAICGTSNKREIRVATTSDTIQIADTSSTEPLLMGMADVTLAATQATASLYLTRQTAEVAIDPITLNVTTQSATVTLSTLYSGIDMNANLHNAGAISLPLRRIDGRWSTAACHLLPSDGSSIAVSLEVVGDDGMPHTYGYVLQERLKAGGRYQIAPSDNAEISFDGEEPSDTSLTTDDGYLLGQRIVAPCLWKSHVVVQVDSISPSEADLMLLSYNEWDGIHSAFYEADSTEAQTIAAQYAEGSDGIGQLDGWHIPTKEEATALRNCYATDSAAVLNALLSDAGYVTISLKKKSDNVRYLCNDAQHTFTFASPTASLTKAGAKATYNLRLVKNVRVRIDGQ